MAFTNTLHSEARFLFLVQALEIYHARSPKFSSTELPREEHEKLLAEAQKALPEAMWEWAGGKLRMNWRSLRQKLADLFTDYSAESNRLFGDVQLTAKRIAYTRNYLTHRSDDVDARWLMSDAEITVAGWTLEAFLWAIFLHEIGVEGAPIDRIITRATEIHYVRIGD